MAFENVLPLNYTPTVVADVAALKALAGPFTEGDQVYVLADGAYVQWQSANALAENQANGIFVPNSAPPTGRWVYVAQDVPGIVRVQNAGTPLALRPQLNFTGSGIGSITDDAANDRTNVDISGGGGGGTSVTQTAEFASCQTGNGTANNNQALVAVFYTGPRSLTVTTMRCFADQQSGQNLIGCIWVWNGGTGFNTVASGSTAPQAAVTRINTFTFPAVALASNQWYALGVFGSTSGPLLSLRGADAGTAGVVTAPFGGGIGNLSTPGSYSNISGININNSVPWIMFD